MPLSTADRQRGVFRAYRWAKVVQSSPIARQTAKIGSASSFPPESGVANHQIQKISTTLLGFDPRSQISSKPELGLVCDAQNWGSSEQDFSLIAA
jgi:hypothetical protein